MTKRLFTILMLTTAMVLTIWANPVSQQEARRKATDFLKQYGCDIQAAPAKIRRRSAAATADADYYVFNAAQSKGFVIISGDDSTVDILGYCEQGSFDEDALPDNMRQWLEDCSTQLELIRSGQVQAASWRTIAAHDDVTPMTTTRWDQREPFNNSCPKEWGTHCVTGCVATAIAQVMYYHRWPTGETGALDAYTTKNGMEVEALPSVTFDWDNMLQEYSYGNYTDTQAEAVATLMRYCGQGSLMNYGTSESGASYTNSVNALKTAFGYDQDIRRIPSRLFDMTTWENRVYTELTTNGPVAYEGNSGDTGHAFVIDGYRKSDKLYHVNWGWSGNYDGWFRLFILNPQGTGTGGGSSTTGYRYYQAMIENFKKDDGINESAAIIPESHLYAQEPIMAVVDNPEESWRKVPKFYYMNRSLKNVTYDYSFVLINANGSLDPLNKYTYEFPACGEYYANPDWTNWFAQYHKGKTLKLSFASKLPESTEWILFTDPSNYMEVKISETGEVTYTTHIGAPSYDIKATCFSVEGSHKSNDNHRLTFTVGPGTKDFRGDLHIFSNNGNDNRTSKIGSIFLALEAGQSEQVTVDFTPFYAGTHTLSIATDEAGQQVIGTCQFDVSEYYNLSVSDYRCETTATTATLTIRVHNNSSTTYSRPFVARVVYDLDSYDDNTDFYTAYISRQQDITLESGEEKDYQFTFDGLTKGKEYVVGYFYLYDPDSEELRRTGDCMEFTVTNDYRLYASIKCETNTKELTASCHITVGNHNDIAYNRDIIVKLESQSMWGGWEQVDTRSQTVNIAGESDQKLDLTFESLTPRTTYRIKVYALRDPDSEEESEIASMQFDMPDNFTLTFDNYTLSPDGTLTIQYTANTTVDYNHEMRAYLYQGEWDEVCHTSWNKTIPADVATKVRFTFPDITEGYYHLVVYEYVEGDWIWYKLYNDYINVSVTEGIAELSTDADRHVTYYDLNGKTVPSPISNGVYIQRSATDRRQGRSGRKVIVR